MLNDIFEDTINQFCHLQPEKQVEIIKKFYRSFIDDIPTPVERLFTDVDTEKFRPSKYISEINNFSVGYGIDEKTIDTVFKKLNSNNDISEILTKVLVVNQLYSTRLNSFNSGNTISVKEMANHIKRIWKDNFDKVDVVNNPVKMVALVGDKKNFDIETIGRNVNSAFSFASKYLSFTYRNMNEEYDSIPITDTFARATLQKMEGIRSFGNFEYYENYYNAITRIREEYQKIDKDIGYKEIDAFLWIMGKAFKVE